MQTAHRAAARSEPDAGELLPTRIARVPAKRGPVTAAARVVARLPDVSDSTVGPRTMMAANLADELPPLVLDTLPPPAVDFNTDDTFLSEADATPGPADSYQPARRNPATMIANKPTALPAAVSAVDAKQSAQRMMHWIRRLRPGLAPLRTVSLVTLLKALTAIVQQPKVWLAGVLAVALQLAAALMLTQPEDRTPDAKRSTGLHTSQKHQGSNVQPPASATGIGLPGVTIHNEPAPRASVSTIGDGDYLRTGSAVDDGDPGDAGSDQRASPGNEGYWQSPAERYADRRFATEDHTVGDRAAGGPADRDRAAGALDSEDHDAQDYEAPDYEGADHEVPDHEVAGEPPVASLRGIEPFDGDDDSFMSDGSQR